MCIRDRGTADAIAKTKVIDEVKVELATTGDVFSNREFYITVNVTSGSCYVDTNNNGKQDSDEPTVPATIDALAAGDFTIVDNQNIAYKVDYVANNYFKVTPNADNTDSSKLWVTVSYDILYGQKVVSKVINETCLLYTSRCV